MSDPQATTPRTLARLAYPFRLVAFDWDGTAVMGRLDDATKVCSVLARLMASGATVVVVTGTNMDHLKGPLAPLFRSARDGRLAVATNRGSEVFGAHDGSPALISRREATREENEALDRGVEALRDRLGERGIETSIVYDRLNRRKLDLIPVPEWRDPPKWKIGPLLEAVSDRLARGQVDGGLRKVLEWSVELAKASGLPDPRVTSDVKHIEIGLTDKSDSIDWMMNELVTGQGIDPQDVLILGDEFGPIGGAHGSDFKMVTSSSRAAIFVSVGPEPNGPPDGVLHIAGGPRRFRNLLETIAEVREGRRPPGELRPSLLLPLDEGEEETWRVHEEGIDPVRERAIEALLAIGNGYVGTRASLAEGALFASNPATFMAGLFDLPTDATEGARVPEYAICPNWTIVRFIVEGEELRLTPETFLENSRTLDMAQGSSWRTWRHRDALGRITSLRGYRLASLADRHLLLQSLTLVPENYSGRVEIEAAIEPATEDVGGLRSPRPRLIPAGPLRREPLDGVSSALFETPSRHVRLGVAMSAALSGPEGFAAERRTGSHPGGMTVRWAFDARMGAIYRFDRIVALATTRDVADEGDDPATTARWRLEQVPTAEVLTGRHQAAWASRWKNGDIVIEGDPEAERALRFAAYHLVSAANPEDERVSIGARTLTGDAYKGHVFWDTETFMLPYFIFTYPEAARAMLMYRFHTISRARTKAQSMGYRGALYPWESADTGEETTPLTMVAPNGEILKILCGLEEHHISADIAYAVHQYWNATRDDAFFAEAGAEILLETARFWASRGQLEKGVFHIRKVIGPDEYHESVDDDAFTNLMAGWNLEAGADALDWLHREAPSELRALERRLSLAPGEASEWRNLAKRMALRVDPSTGVLEQFDGYFQLEPYDLGPLREQGRWSVPLDLLLGRSRIHRTQVVKQADVVMALQLLWDRFTPEQRLANFRYYEPRTCHGSSLSPATHSLVAARLGLSSLAMHYFRQATLIDLASDANAAAGVHGAALGGLWQACAMGFLGMEAGDELSFRMNLPTAWTRVELPVLWRGERVVARAVSELESAGAAP